MQLKFVEQTFEKLMLSFKMYFFFALFIPSVVLVNISGVGFFLYFFVQKQMAGLQSTVTALSTISAARKQRGIDGNPAITSKLACKVNKPSN